MVAAYSVRAPRSRPLVVCHCGRGTIRRGRTSTVRRAGYFADDSADSATMERGPGCVRTEASDTCGTRILQNGRMVPLWKCEFSMNTDRDGSRREVCHCEVEAGASGPTFSRAVLDGSANRIEKGLRCQRPGVSRVRGSGSRQRATSPRKSLVPCPRELERRPRGSQLADSFRIFSFCFINVPLIVNSTLAFAHLQNCR